MQRVGMNLVRAKAAAISLLTRVRGSPGSYSTPLQKDEKAASKIERLFRFEHYYQRERPTLEKMLKAGDCEEPVPHGLHIELRVFMSRLKKAREGAGLSLAVVAKRSGIDKAALSRLENGQHINPTIDTLYRYAEALGKSLVLDFADAE